MISKIRTAILTPSYDLSTTYIPREGLVLAISRQQKGQYRILGTFNPPSEIRAEDRYFRKLTFKLQEAFYIGYVMDERHPTKHWVTKIVQNTQNYIEDTLLSTIGTTRDGFPKSSNWTFLFQNTKHMTLSGRHDDNS